MHTRHIVSCALVLTLAPAIALAAANTDIELPVKLPHGLGASHGTLIFSDQGIEYRTTHQPDARRWSYRDVKQAQVLSPTRVSVLTYEKQGWMKAWRDRTFAFELEKGAVTPAIVASLLEKTPRPIVSAVLPPLDTPPQFNVPVRHARFREGSEGQLELYPGALVYRSEQPGESRYWRFSDLALALPIDRFRLEVVAYEGGAGQTRSFLFQLKEDLPPGFSDTLWMRTNEPTRGGDRGANLHGIGS